MKYIFNFPDIGEGLDEGVIVEWKVKKGQSVESGDPLVTMETDKVVTDIPSPKTGVLSRLFGKEGETINVGDALVEIEIEGVAGDAAVEEVEKGNDLDAVEEEGAGVVGTLEIADNNSVLTASDESDDEETSEKTEKKKALATPVSRAIAKDMGIDINQVKGTGPAGRVMKDDILNYAKDQKSGGSKKSSAASKDSQERVKVEALSQMRKTIAKNMIESKRNAAHMTVFDDVEISELDAVRKRYKEKYLEDGVKLTYLAFIVKAAVLALKKFPAINAEMDLENGNMIYKNYYNIGIAVDTKKGLVVPNIKDADNLSIVEIAKEIQELSARARDGKLSMDDFKDGTFSITSYGSIGGKYATPVINYPQAGILGIGRIHKQPIVKDDKLDIGLVLPLALTADHRIVDGADASRFINTIMQYLGDPVSIILE